MTQKHKWIKPNEAVEVQGIKLTRGGFYLGDRFVFDNIADGVECNAKYVSQFVIQPELKISNEEDKKYTSDETASYQGLLKYERFLFLMWLSQHNSYDKLSSRVLKLRSHLIFRIYFTGLQIRMFVDGETTMEERVELLLYANKLKSYAQQANLHRELDEFINYSVAKYFIDEPRVIKSLKGFNIEDNDKYKTSQIEKFLEKNKVKKLNATNAFDLCVNVLNLNFEPQQYTKSRFKTQWDKLSKGLTLGEESSSVYSIAPEMANISVEIYKTKCSSHIILGIIKKIYADISTKFRAYNSTAKSFSNQDFLILQLPANIKVDPNHAVDIESKLLQIFDMYGYANIGMLFESFGYIKKCEDRPSYSNYKVVSDTLRKFGYCIYPAYQDDNVKFSNQCLIYKSEYDDIDLCKCSVHIKLIVFIMSAAQILKNQAVSIDSRKCLYDYINKNCDVEVERHRYYIYLEQLILVPQRIGAKQFQIDCLTTLEREDIISILSSLLTINGNNDLRGVDYLSQLHKRFGIKRKAINIIRSEVKSNIYREQVQEGNLLVSQMATNKSVLEILIVAISISRLTYSDQIKQEYNKFKSYITANYSDPNVLKFTNKELEKVFRGSSKINSYYAKLISVLDDSRKRTVLVSFVKYYCTDKILLQGQINAIKKIFSIFGEQSRKKDFQNIINKICYEGEAAFAAMYATKHTDASANVKDNTAATNTSNTELDVAKLAKIEQQTKDVHRLLSEIFVSDDDNEIVESKLAINPAIELLKIILEKESWARAEVEQLCQSRGVMLGATLEQINDYAYEKIDDAVVEDDGDEIYVTIEYKDKLL